MFRNLHLFETDFNAKSKKYQFFVKERFIMGFSASHLLLVVLGVLLVFGAGRLPQVMSDFARGIRAFKKGMSEDDEPNSPPPSSLPKHDHQAPK